MTKCDLFPQMGPQEHTVEMHEAQAFSAACNSVGDQVRAMQEHHSFHDSSVNLNYPKTEFVKKLKACSNIHELNEEAMKIISQHE